MFLHKLSSPPVMSSILNPTPLQLNLYIFFSSTRSSLSQEHLNKVNFFYNLVATYPPNNITRSLFFLCLFYLSPPPPNNDIKLWVWGLFLSYASRTSSPSRTYFSLKTPLLPKASVCSLAVAILRRLRVSGLVMDWVDSYFQVAEWLQR